MKSILLVEDQLDTQLIVKNIIATRYYLSVASSAGEAFSLLKNSLYELILLDLSLPDGNGFEICTQIKSDNKMRSVPIIFLTSDSRIQSKIIGFSLGAEDYIVKPFDPLELKIRVESRLRKASENRENEEYLYTSGFMIHTISQKVYLMGSSHEKDLGLSPVEFKIFFFFAKNEGRVLTRELLLYSIWGHDADLYERVIDKHISTLRHKLGTSSHLITTIHGGGYSFNPTVSSQPLKKLSTLKKAA
jgi:DNA-binding response OmpR family regulator